MKPNKVKNVKENSKKIPKKRGNSTLIIGIVAVILLAGIAYAAGIQVTGFCGIVTFTMTGRMTTMLLSAMYA